MYGGEAMTYSSSGTRAGSLRRASIWKRYGYIWVTGALFFVSLGGQWWLGWHAFVSEQQMHGASVEFADYFSQLGRDTLENWQSEFLQLIWQVAGLALLLSVHSPQSRDEDDRLEEKLDAILRAVNPDQANHLIAELDERFDRGQPSA
jgi:hypothetical protein